MASFMMMIICRMITPHLKPIAANSAVPWELHAQHLLETPPGSSRNGRSRLTVRWTALCRPSCNGNLQFSSLRKLNYIN